MLINPKYPTLALFVLAFGGVVTQTSLQAASGDPLENNIQKSGDLLSSIVSTGDDLDSENHWFCTKLKDGKYINRVSFDFWANGAGKIDGREINWVVDSNTLLVSGNLDQMILSDFNFSSRIAPNDRFRVSISSTEELDCDWVGPYRSGIFLDSSVDYTNAAFSDGDVESVDVLLKTGNLDSEVDRYWSCSTVDDNGALSSSEKVYFYDRIFRKGFSTGAWRSIGSSSIALTYANGNIEKWENIRFSALEVHDQTPNFEVVSGNGVVLRCNLQGPPRSQKL